MTAAFRWTLGMFLLAAACSRRDGRNVGGPSVALVDRVVLAEPDSITLGAVPYFDRDRAGNLYVSLTATGQVLRFGADGRLVTIIGRKGNGPGELQSPSAIKVLPGDSSFAVVDLGRSYLSRFTADGRFLGGFTTPARDIGLNWSYQGDTAFFALGLHPALIGRWRLGDDSIGLVGVTPTRLLAAPKAMLTYGRPDAIATPRGFLAVLATDPGIHVLDVRGMPTGFVRVGARLRRGTPEDLLAKDAGRSPTDPRALQPLGSITVSLHRLATGDIALVYLDFDQTKEWNPAEMSPSMNYFGNFRFYVTLVNQDLSRQRLDGPVSLTTSEASVPVFQGDTLAFLTRPPGGDTPPLVVTRFVVSDNGCDWKPTGGIGPARP